MNIDNDILLLSNTKKHKIQEDKPMINTKSLKTVFQQLEGEMLKKPDIILNIDRFSSYFMNKSLHIINNYCKSSKYD